MLEAHMIDLGVEVLLRGFRGKKAEEAKVFPNKWLFPSKHTLKQLVRLSAQA